MQGRTNTKLSVLYCLACNVHYCSVSKITMALFFLQLHQSYSTVNLNGLKTCYITHNPKQTAKVFQIPLTLHQMLIPHQMKTMKMQEEQCYQEEGIYEVEYLVL